jgi:hypothetical protein
VVRVLGVRELELLNNVKEPRSLRLPKVKLGRVGRNHQENQGNGVEYV